MSSIETASREGTPADLSVVRTTSGPVSGSKSGDIHSFKGIPYAAPPVGPLRWRPPQPPASWQDVRVSTEFGPAPPQNRSPVGKIDEDCLSMNVWTPAKRADEKLPVMVWIHGGGFQAGRSSEPRTDGETFAHKGVVLASFNYRVGVLGFLAHPQLSRESEHGVSGNYALLDQMLALRWVKDNIAAFGGDPDRVTIFGVSAGSASIALLMASPLAKGLFDQVILESPGTFRPLFGLKEAEQKGQTIGDDIEALRKLSVEDILNTKQPMLIPAMRGLTTPRLLRPIRDGWVLPEDERPAFRAGRFHAVPTLVGSNLDEGTKLTASWTVKTVADWDRLIDENFARHREGAAKAYPIASDADVVTTVAEVFADTQFNYGTWALAQVVAGKQPKVFRYLFSRRAPGLKDGPHHGDEVTYVFRSLKTSGQQGNFDATDERLASEMQDAWVRFATNGDPNGGSLPNWPSVRTDANAYMDFGDTTRLSHGWRQKQVEFLEQVYEAEAAA